MIRCILAALALAVSLPASAHLTARERAALIRLDDAVHQLLEDGGTNPGPEDPVIPKPRPVPTPEPQDPETAEWRCYLDRYEDLRINQLDRKKKLPYTETWAVRHWEHPVWGGKAQGRIWGCIDEPEVPPDAVGQRRFHHYNASAWKDRGVAVILCPGDRATKATIGGEGLVRHGNLDKGREAWADYNTRGLIGELVLVIDGVAYRAPITDRGGVTKGDCWSRG